MGLFLKIDKGQNRPKSCQYLGYFYKKICCGELSLNAQSGHSARDYHMKLFPYWLITLLRNNASRLVNNYLCVLLWNTFHDIISRCPKGLIQTDNNKWVNLRRMLQGQNIFNHFFLAFSEQLFHVVKLILFSKRCPDKVGLTYF